MSAKSRILKRLRGDAADLLDTWAVRITPTCASRGGMGVVYLACNALMDRLEVLKVMNRKSVQRPGAADRFLREIQAAARLSHPNVVRA